MERRLTRCAIYTRQSVARPNGSDFTSCDAQRDICLLRIRANALQGWIALEERFDDVGQSSATMDRPALQRLLERVAAREVDRVVVHRLDRLVRSVRAWTEIVATLKRYGAQLTIVAGDLQLGDLVMDNLVLNVLASFAEFEREIIGERLRDARASLRIRGIRNAGRVPFGYTADELTRQLVVQPEQAQTVKRMFEMAADGAPPSAIAMWINSLSHDDRRVLNGRAAWSPKGVLRVLGNRVYVGRMGAVADAHDAIVDEQLLAKVREAVDARRTRAPGRRNQEAGDLFLLRRLLRCVHCDRLMTTSSSRALPDGPTKPKGRKLVVPPRYYRCRGQRACRGTQVAAEDIEQRVLAWLRKPTGDVFAEAQFVLTRYAPIWEVLFPQVVRGLVAQLIWEVQWDGQSDRFTVVLDETAIAEEYAKLKRRDEERATRTTPRRKKVKRTRSRVSEP
jgi:DNA invertase Pin-like site-specific DNA recombinase